MKLQLILPNRKILLSAFAVQQILALHNQPIKVILVVTKGRDCSELPFKTTEDNNIEGDCKL